MNRVTSIPVAHDLARLPNLAEEESIAQACAVEIATWLLARPRSAHREPLASAVVQQIWNWSASETRCEEFCAWINHHAKNVGDKHELLELVRESQLSCAVSAHASLHGEVVVRELIPDLFAILVL